MFLFVNYWTVVLMKRECFGPNARLCGTSDLSCVSGDVPSVFDMRTSGNEKWFTFYKIHIFGPKLESLPPSFISFTMRAVQMMTEATRTQTCLQVLQGLSWVQQKLGRFVSLNVRVLTALFIAVRKIEY